MLFRNISIIAALTLLLTSCTATYHHNSGAVFGTMYHVTYLSADDL